MTITLNLPYPVSANKLWRAVRGRNIKSAEYRAWEEAAGYMIVSQRPGYIAGPFEISLTFGRPDKRRRDLGNLEKASMDALVRFKVIEDDCLAQKITLEWGDVEGVRAVVTSVSEHIDNGKGQ